MSNPQAPPAEPLTPTDLPQDVLAALEARWRAAARVHRSMALSLEDFVIDVLALWARGRTRQSLPTDVDAFREDAERLHYDDLFLARLCDRGDESAWRAFTVRYAPDLRSVLQRHTDADEADRIASAVLADAALPPKRSPERTLLGTYEGSGPLWAWLATIGTRRVRRTWRQRESPLEAAGEPQTPAAAPLAELDAEAERFLLALQTAWDALEPREALALAWKHGDGLAQREVARLLDTSEPTVSRLIQRAVSKIRGCLADGTADFSVDSRASWTRLEAVLSNHFERLRVQRHWEAEES